MAAGYGYGYGSGALGGALGGASSGASGQIDRDLELLRRMLEVKANQPVELQRELSEYHMGGMTRIYFRHDGYHMIVDTRGIEHGEPIERIADAVFREFQRHCHNRENQGMRQAYESMGDYTPDWNKQRQQDAYNEKKEKKAQAFDKLKQGRSNAMQAAMCAAPVGTKDNPLRVELQKKVDAWLKE